ncbi:MAG: phosphoribosylaminoimidazolesuccinocarboxamide synthase [Deltaproteobacteria bacterium]|nr:phosphoribosylaminoimidazolesuccinocarboxamide synthase [Deltaproteobacteria bacterium]
MVDEKTLREALDRTLESTELAGLGALRRGKVRDSYVGRERRVIVTTDRLSAFDRVLTTLPFKGQVLNRCAAFWFDKTRDVVPNHVLSVPDPSAMVVTECALIPVEMVVRGYMTGTTTTSIWYRYEKGDRLYCGHELPDGLRKHQRLERPLITPTTKAEGGAHDALASREELIAMGACDARTFDAMAEHALTLFRIGQEHCARNGLLLVDTKYEFGRAKDGTIVVIDEVHTPDSSRFWVAGTYEQRLAEGGDPDALDKEYVRRWYAARGFRGDGEAPAIPDEVRVEAARRYIDAFERITGTSFVPDREDPAARLARNLAPFAG